MAGVVVPVRLQRVIKEPEIKRDGAGAGNRRRHSSTTATAETDGERHATTTVGENSHGKNSESPPEGDATPKDPASVTTGTTVRYRADVQRTPESPLASVDKLQKRLAFQLLDPMQWRVAASNGLDAASAHPISSRHIPGTAAKCSRPIGEDLAIHP